MSTYYCIYAEALENGTWRCINLYSKNKVNGEYELVPVYWSGSRSYFGDAAKKLTENGCRLKDPTALSPELCEYFDERFEEDYTKFTYLTMLHDLRRIMPAPDEHQYHGIVHRDQAFAFEHGETEYLEPITSDEYAALPLPMRDCYRYYEWDDPMEWVANLRDVLNGVDLLLAFRPPWERDSGIIRLVTTIT